MSCAKVISQIEVLPAGELGRWRGWSAAEKVRIVEESLSHRQIHATILANWGLSGTEPYGKQHRSRLYLDASSCLAGVLSEGKSMIGSPLSYFRSASLAAIAVIAALTLPATRVAAEEAGWGQVFSPNRIAELLVQYGIQTARGFVDLTYQDLSVDLLGSRASVRRVKVWPMPDWEGSEDCVISIDQIELTGSPTVEIENSKAEMALRGLTAPLVCLPAELRLPVVAAGQDQIQIDFLNAKFDYNIPDSSLTAQVNARIPSFASLELDADVAYISFWLRDRNETQPVIYLNGAKIRLENLGGWEALKPLLPPSVTDPKSGPEGLNDLLSALFSAFGVKEPRSEAQSRFLESAKLTWGKFLLEPSQLTLTFLEGADGASYIDFEALDSDFNQIFVQLEPRLTSGWRPLTSLVTPGLIADARAKDMPSEERLRIAEALIQGNGVPRNTSLGVEILNDLAAAGDLKAQATLAELLSEVDIERAYGLAINAAAGGSEAAMLLIDRLEHKMAWRMVEAVQPKVTEISQASIRSDKDIGLIRAKASSALHGRGTARSYAQAMFWALIGRAFGDQESEWIIQEVERRVSQLDGNDLQTFLGPIEDEALQFWFEQSAGNLNDPKIVDEEPETGLAMESIERDANYSELEGQDSDWSSAQVRRRSVEAVIAEALRERLKSARQLAELTAERDALVSEVEALRGTNLDAASLREDAEPSAPMGPPLTDGEKDALRVAVSSCWNVGSLSADALATTVVVAVSLQETGVPDSRSIRLVSFSGGSESGARQAFEVARRAIIRCGAQGFPLPVEKYSQWREIKMTFDPEGLRLR